jgi:hypothetical protein
MKMDTKGLFEMKNVSKKSGKRGLGKVNMFSGQRGKKGLKHHKSRGLLS